MHLRRFYSLLATRYPLLLALACFAGLPIASAQTGSKDLRLLGLSNQLLSGAVFTVNSGATFTVSGVLSGTPTGGTLNLSALTLTLPATVSGGTSSFQPLDAELTAISGLAVNGLITRTSSTTVEARTITGTAGQITVTNGDGVSGNPTLALPTALTGVNSLTSAALSNLTLGTGTFGTALTFASATGAATFAGTTASTSTTTGSLINSGGFGNAGAAFFGGSLNLNNGGILFQMDGTTIASTIGLWFRQASPSASNYGLSGDTSNTILNAPSGGSVALRIANGNYFALTAAGGYVLQNGRVNVTDTTSASSSTVGALTVGNGTAATNVGIGGGNINAGGTLTIGGVSAFTPAARTSGSASYFTVTTPADTTLTASTESIGANFTAATRQWSTGALTTQRERVFAAPTNSFVAASTITTAINVDIADPIQGTNATQTNTFGLRVNRAQVTNQLVSTVSTGTAPFVVASTTNIPNLNASSLNGATFAAPGPVGSTTPSTGAFTSLSSTLPMRNGGLVRTTADVAVTSNVTLANVTGLSINVAAATSYTFRVWAPTTAAAAGGIQFAIGGTATVTSLIYEGYIDGATKTRASTLGTAVSSSASATTGTATIQGTITVNAAGTLTVQFAQNTSNASASTVLRGATFEVFQTNN